MRQRLIKCTKNHFISIDSDCVITYTISRELNDRRAGGVSLLVEAVLRFNRPVYTGRSEVERKLTNICEMFSALITPQNRDKIDTKEQKQRVVIYHNFCKSLQIVREKRDICK